MPRKRVEDLSPAEWKVMRIIWEQKSCATRDVMAAAGKTYGWTRSTVKTILHRIVEKGYASITQVGNCYLYRPSRPPLKSLLEAADNLLDITLDGMTGPVLAHMVKNSNLSHEEIQRLRDLLETQAREKEPEP